jgi:hypothetical protein
MTNKSSKFTGVWKAGNGVGNNQRKRTEIVVNIEIRKVLQVGLLQLILNTKSVDRLWAQCSHQYHERTMYQPWQLKLSKI